MSILPTDTQGSTSSTSSSSNFIDPNSNHGRSLHLSRSPPSLSRLHISPSPSPPDKSSGPVAVAAEDSGGSSRKVSKLRTPIGNISSAHQNSGFHHNGEPASERGLGFTHSRGRPSGGGTGSPGTQPNNRSGNSNGHTSGRKNHAVSANHLLNFQYDPISRPQPRAPPPRRQQKIKPYNKDLFLQANYRFVVLDSGNYTQESLDPDKMLQWEDIICVRYSSPLPVQCTICLEYPLCPQITSCGHVFCFPCILRYLLMGKEDDKGDCWKRCPLCFMMISPKELYTVYIESVRSYSVGDSIDFMLLTRRKDSFAIHEKKNPETETTASLNENESDSFSKFTFTSDVDLSVRKAISDLDSWLVQAESGLVDDLEKLPYVSAAMEQLEERKKFWKSHRVSEKTVALDKTDVQIRPQVPVTGMNATCSNHTVDGIFQEPSDAVDQNKLFTKSASEKLNREAFSIQAAEDVESLEGQGTVLSSSFDENKTSDGHSFGSRDLKDRDSYNFYQAVDGQHLILHPLNMKCLLHHYGSYDMVPNRISGKILQLETVTQTDVMRRRYRFLSHFSLTTTFQLCEIDLCDMLPPDSLSPFMDEIKKRETQRKRLAKKEEKEKIKADVAAAEYLALVQSSLGHFSQSYGSSLPFSMDEFEALGSSSATSSGPPVTADASVAGERKTFSNVTKLGYAAGHDSPSLKIEERSPQNSEVISEPSGLTGLWSTGAASFANMITREKSAEKLDVPKVHESGKKGKKPSRVLLSTAGGRRY